MICAVLRGKCNLRSLEGISYTYEMGERRSTNKINSCRNLNRLGCNSLCELYALGNGGIHFPVASDNFLSHLIFRF